MEYRPLILIVATYCVGLSVVQYGTRINLELSVVSKNLSRVLRSNIKRYIRFLLRKKKRSLMSLREREVNSKKRSQMVFGNLKNFQYRRSAVVTLLRCFQHTVFRWK